LARLLELVKQHRMVFLTWTTVLPGFVGTRACRWPSGSPRAGSGPRRTSPRASSRHTGWRRGVAPLGLAMLIVIFYGILVVGELDRSLLEKYFDQAEYWLRSRTAHVVRVFTFGVIDPRQMV